MVSISKEEVLNLREKTGAGLIDCKRALSESNGNLDDAVSILRKKGVASAAKKAGRDAGEGIIAEFISEDRSKGILVEVNCETDFVAKNEDFISFSNFVATQLLENPNSDLEQARAEQVGKIGENIRISRSEVICPKKNGIVQSYIHTGNKVAVLISLISEKNILLGANENVLNMAKDFCMHIAATSPICISREEVPSELVDKEREIAMAQAVGKPPQAIEKIIQGKLEKYFSTYCFLEQPFVKNPDQSINELLQAVSRDVDCEIRVDKFVRFQVGEET